MTGPIGAIAAIAKAGLTEVGKASVRDAVVDVLRHALRVHRVLSAVEREDPLAALGASHELLRSVPLRTEYGGLFSGVNAALGRGEALRDRLGLRGVVYQGRESLAELRRAVTGGESFTVIVPSLTDLAAAEQDLLRAADEHGVLLTARKVEFVIGSDYEEGAITQMPRVGSLCRLAFKGQLGENITVADLVRAGADLASIITMAVGAPAVGSVGAALVGGAGVGTVAGEGAAVTAIGAAPEALASATTDALGTTVATQAWEPAPYSDLAGLAEARRLATGEGFRLPEGFAHPGHFRERFAAIEQQLDAHAAHVFEREPAWAKMCRRNVDRLIQARELGPGEVQRVMSSIKQNAAGEFARQVVLDALKPFFARHRTEVTVRLDGSVGRIDVRFEGALVPIHGKGGFYVPVGGSCSVEVKAGGVPYLQSQFEHLLLQGKHGLSVSDAAMTITTGDVKGLEAALEARLRAALRPTAPLYKFLPEKRIIDRVVCDLHQRLAQAATSSGGAR